MRIYCVTVRCAVALEHIQAAVDALDDHHAATPAAFALGLLVCTSFALVRARAQLRPGRGMRHAETSVMVCGLLLLAATVRLATWPATEPLPVCAPPLTIAASASPPRNEHKQPVLPALLSGNLQDDSETFLRWAMMAKVSPDAIRRAARSSNELRPLHDHHSATVATLSPASCLLLGYLAGFRRAQRRNILHQFLGSFRRAGSSGHAVIVHDGELCSEVASQHRAQCIDYHTLPSYNETKRLRGTAAYVHAAKVAARFMYWDDYLTRAPPSITHVLCSDLRDVVFLGADIFTMMPPVHSGRPLLFFAEHTNVLSGEDEPFNSHCRRCVAAGAISASSCPAINGLPMLNCGLMYGTRDGMRRFLQVYARALRATRYMCWDQMLFSMLVWSGAFQPVDRLWDAQTTEPVPIVLAESSAVCTIGFRQAIGVRGASHVLNALGVLCWLEPEHECLPKP